MSTPVQQPAAPAPAGGGGDSGGGGGEAVPMRGARERTGSGLVPVVGILLALCTLGLGVVAVHDGLVALGTLSGPAWLQAAVEAVRGTTPETWMVPVGVALALLGLWLALRVALGRRTRHEMRLRSRTAVSVEPRDVARLASTTAREVDGVLGAKSSAERRKVVVRVTTTGDPGVSEAVERAVTERLALIERAPSVRVRAEEGNR